ncbi:MAG: HD domain-containing phosphohydrolase, partial [Nitrospirales bacterium]
VAEAVVEHDTAALGSSGDLPHATTREERVSTYERRRQHLLQADSAYRNMLKSGSRALRKLGNGDAQGLTLAGEMVSKLDSVIQMDRVTIALIELMNANDMEESQQFHAINVCVLSTLVGREFGLSQQEIQELGLGALSHDLGLLHPVKEVRIVDGRFVPDPHDEKRHPQRGGEIAQGISGFPARAANVILQHHERLDGSGYPAGLREEATDLFAQIVGVVDEYDERCNNPDRTRALTPYETLSQMYHETTVTKRSGCSEKVLVTLIHVLGVYPPGTLVELDDGRIGKVVGIDLAQRARPQVMLYSNEVGSGEALIVDLAHENGSIARSLRPNDVRAELHSFFQPDRPQGYFPLLIDDSPVATPA